MWKPAPLIWNTQMGEESMSDRKPMILVFAGPNGSGKSTIFSNDLWSEDKIEKLMHE